MLLGALLDTGINKKSFLKELRKLKITDNEHRAYIEIKNIIEKSKLSKFVKQKSIAVFKCLAKAEAKIHGTSLKNIHFHEIGRKENIISIVGSIMCLELLGIKKIYSSSLNLGKGTVKC